MRHLCLLEGRRAFTRKLGHHLHYTLFPVCFGSWVCSDVCSRLLKHTSVVCVCVQNSNYQDHSCRTRRRLVRGYKRQHQREVTFCRDLSAMHTFQETESSTPPLPQKHSGIFSAGLSGCKTSRPRPLLSHNVVGNPTLNL